MTADGVRRIMLRFLRSQKTNVWCAISAAFLLGAGSIVADRLPEAYAGLSMDDLRFFFAPPRAIHAWFYLLCLVLAVWGTSAAVVTWDGIVARVRARLWRPTAWGPVLLHVGFPLALMAHLWGGFGGSVAVHRVGPQPTPVGDAEYRVVGVEEEQHPSGATRMVTATLERRGADVDHVEVSYNGPCTSELGARELLMLKHVPLPGAALAAPDGETVALAPGQRAVVGDRVVRLGRLFQGRGMRTPVAEVIVDFPERGAHFVPLGETTPDGAVAFAAVQPSAMLILMDRRNPSVPLVVGVSILLVVGVLLTAWDRRARARRAMPK